MLCTSTFKVHLDDFRFGKLLGEGGFSKVYLATHIHTNRKFAIKICKKIQKNREPGKDYTQREHKSMQILSDVPGFVSLLCTFQDEQNYYFVMTYAENGDILTCIKKVGLFNKKCTQYYAAELILSLENMHRKGVIHRDLKPANILFDKNMHTFIADFNTAKILTEVNKEWFNIHQQQRYSFVGTPRYLSPEIINRQCSSKSIDLWGLGCIIYHMLSGSPPFNGATKRIVFDKILKLDLIFPDEFDETARDLVEKLLKIDPTQRLGMADETHCYQSIRQHPFFDGIEWNGLREQTPPIIGNEERLLNKHNLEPDLRDQQLASALELETSMPIQTKDKCENLLKMPYHEGHQLTKPKMDEWHQYVNGEVIIKQGLVKKRKWLLFAENQMLILTTGPHLIYVDPVRKVKGEIPWSSQLRAESKNGKQFFVQTPNQTYRLEDPQGSAFEWCDTIEMLRQQTYGG